MAKKIEDLPSDIYKVLEDGVEFTDEEITDLASMIKAKLKGKRDESSHLRMSNFGFPCERRLWLQQHKGDTAEALPGRARFNFLYGDIIESLVLALAKKAGHSVEGEQEELDLHGVKGHRDAIIDGITADVKSANSRSIKKFKYGEVPYNDAFGYMDQLDMYRTASQSDDRVQVKREAAFVAVDKELGNIYVDKYKFEDTDWEGRIAEKRAILDSPTPPPRPYEPEPADYKQNRVIPRVPCGYCPFKQECWKDVRQGKGLRTFITPRGPLFYTSIKKMPSHPEVTDE